LVASGKVREMPEDEPPCLDNIQNLAVFLNENTIGLSEFPAWRHWKCYSLDNAKNAALSISNGSGDY
jgi:hypothetical protein